MALTAEQAFMFALSCRTWGRRAAAKHAGLPYNEETITETILLDLATSYPGNVSIVAYNKVQEAQTGADWLWSFISADGSHSFTMLVQAKRLDDAEQDYSGTNRNVGKIRPPVRQIDRLTTIAAAQGVQAAYAFYNHVSDQSRVPTTCRSLASGDPAHIVGFGISVADAAAVRHILPDESFDSHRAHSIPLHCLLCNGAKDKRAPGGTPVAIARSFMLLRQIEGDDLRNIPGFQQGIHPTVKAAFDQSSRPEGELPREGPPGIAGVIMLRDGDDETVDHFTGFGIKDRNTEDS